MAIPEHVARRLWAYSEHRQKHVLPRRMFSLKVWAATASLWVELVVHTWQSFSPVVERYL